jgi:2,4-dienoyl-CoA reductase-like NADH-dependent reductase (Old Yellow Enzyme family)
MDRSLMKHVIEAHVQAVHRCERIGFDAVELHGAHGYLVSSFLSPIANQRTDEYGGPMQNRMRFPLELFAAMREAWPATKPMGVRFNGTDWDDKGLLLEEAIEFGQALKKLGCDFFDISGGGNNLSRPEVKPAYQVQFATAIKRATGIPTMAVGMIRDPHLAEKLISEGACDMIAIARGFLFEPRWSWKAAYELGATCDYPAQYARANPLLWPQAFPDNQELNDTALDWEVGAAPHIMVPKN